MYNSYVETLFAEREVLYFETCDSTNLEAQKIITREQKKDRSVVYTERQIKGKGQRGSTWESAASKNLTFSIILYPKDLLVGCQFYLSKITALAIHDALLEYIPSSLVRIKWPNDLYVGNKKISGVLIENNLQSSKIKSSIVGIGFNVNQKDFVSTKATSLSKYLSYELNKEAVLKSILDAFDFRYQQLIEKEYEKIDLDYHKALYLKDTLSEFRDEAGNLFSGKILGTNAEGKLILETASEQKTFGIKEIVYTG